MATDFATRIREKYDPQGGLTGVFAIGGTRTTYILEKNRFAPDPGHIGDFSEHADYILSRDRQFLDMFFELGGQNAILTALSFRSFYERGQEYAALIVPEILKIIGDEFRAFYQTRGVDPYFVGIDTLQHLLPESPAHHAAQHLDEFRHGWPYQAGRRKLIWEIASIPLYSIWHVCRHMTEAEQTALSVELEAQTDLEGVVRLMHRHFSRAIYGTEVPMPHFYLGTNKSGYLQWRSPMPLGLTGGEFVRMFYTPYPSLFVTRETLQAILEDLAFGKRFQSLKTDYAGRLSPELAQAEYKRAVDLASRPETTLGLSRQVAAEDSVTE